MTVPRAIACPREWFPPATFQLRLRSLKSIIYIAQSSKENGFIHLSLHVTSTEPPIWESSKLKFDKEERLGWADIEIEPTKANLGLKSIVVKVWHTHLNAKECELVTSWGLYFNGLWCLGTHPPSHGRLPQNSLIFQLSGSYFSSASFIKNTGEGQSNQIPRFLHIGSLKEYQTVKSYDTRLLSKLHMSQRALKQQDSNNVRLINDLRNMGVSRIRVTFPESLQAPKSLCESNETLIINPGALPSLRQTLLVRKVKNSKTRLSEQDLLARIELSRVRLSLLQKERDRLRKAVEDLHADHDNLSTQMEEKTSNQMHCYHNLSKEKAALQSWTEQFKVDLMTNESWLSAMQQERLCIVHSLLEIFPIGDLGGKRPTLRWITLPPADEIRESIRDEKDLSVVVGEVAHLVQVVSVILDQPLRYPFCLKKSVTCILDEIKVFPENEVKRDPALAHGEFPLHLKSFSNNEWSKFEYAMYLLNKNVAQIRWLLGMVTTDIRPTLRNLSEIFALGKEAVRCNLDAAPVILTKATTPSLLKIVPTLVIKNGRVTMSRENSNRKSSVCSDITGGGQASNVEEDSSDDDQQSLDEDDDVIDEDEDPKLSSSATSTEISPEVPETGPVKCENTILPSSPPKTLTGNPPSNESNLFWNDVTSRAKALSTNPSSFQRPRTHHHL